MHAFMLSLDVKSLFTNVPIQGGLDCLEKRLLEFHYSSTEIEKILDLVHLCVRQTAFVFNGVFHSQIEGLEMGSPLSHFQSLSLLMLFPIILLSRKWLPSILMSIVLYIFALILLISPMNLIT